MPGEAAAVKNISGISQGQMQTVTHQIVDQNRITRHAQSLIHELNDLLWFQMMNKERAAYHVKSIIAKGQCQCIAAHARIVAVEVSCGAVEQHRSDLQTIFRE